MISYKLVSVIIPTYKRPGTLPRAINSVVIQSYKNIEIIVVDDNDPTSKERTLTEQIMNSYSNENIHYLQHESNRNGSAARNTGFRYSKGEYIVFLDDDDEFTPYKVENQVRKLEALDDSWGVCYTSYVRKKNGRIVAYGAENREGNLLAEELMRNLFVHAGSNLMVRRTVVDEIGGFDESFMRNQDVEFLSRILIKYKIAYVDMVGLIVHVHEREFSNTNFEVITEEYMRKFSAIIKSLPENEQLRIERMIELQLFRNYLTTKGKRNKVIKQLKHRKINILLAFKYLVHLVRRKLTKRAYGFNI